jgi:nucleotide-binding universal stress UspA family protein
MTEVDNGNATAAIMKARVRQNIDLIVLCSHGYTGLKEWVMSSIAQKIVRASPIPILIQKDEHPLAFARDAKGQPVFRVCIALDGSPQAEAIIESALSIAVDCAPAHHGEVHLLRIVEPSNLVDEQAFAEASLVDMQNDSWQTAQMYIEEVIARLEQDALRYPGIKITGTVRIGTDIAQELMQYAEKGLSNRNTSCQLLAITTHGQHGFDHHIFGSVTERVLKRTRLPLLIVHPQDQVVPQLATQRSAMQVPRSTCSI